MTTVPIIWYTRKVGIDARGPFDTGLIEDLFADKLWPMGLEPEHHHLSPSTPISGFTHAVVVVPARHHAMGEDVAVLNESIATLAGVVVILVGDEESIFPWRELQHPNMKLWVMIPKPSVHRELKGSAFFFGDGYPPRTRDMLNAAQDGVRDIPWVFSGQVTHPRRKQAANALKAVMATMEGSLVETPGFTQGLPRADYLALLAQSKFAPCPSGPETQDTFRFYEALEAGALPIADALTPDGSTGYWEFMYGEMPIPQIADWGTVGTLMSRLLPSWSYNASRAGAWWRQQKVAIARRLHADLWDIGLDAMKEPTVTALITTSPTTKTVDEQMAMIEEVIWSLPGVPILIACDGVRAEQSELHDTYYEYVHQLVMLSHRNPEIMVVVAPQHLHQAALTRAALELIDSPVMLFAEHDTPLSWETIDWEGCINLVLDAYVDVLRFHHEAQIHPEHEHLMRDHDTIHIGADDPGVPVRRTMQWSQRPHLARTAYYREILQKHFTPEGRSFIEDRLHGAVQDHPEEHRIAIYHPEGTIRRSLHTDGRGAAPKFESEQIF